MAHLTRHTDAHPLSLGPPGAYHVHTDTQPPLRPKTWMPVAREEHRYPSCGHDMRMDKVIGGATSTGRKVSE